MPAMTDTPKAEDARGARHAEIKRRYERRKPPKPDYIKAIRRRQVLKLMRHRHGELLPDEDDSCEALRILLALGMDGLRRLHSPPGPTARSTIWPKPKRRTGDSGVRAMSHA